MNDTVMPFQKLDVYRVAFALAKRVHEARIGDEVLRDQARRASKSAFLQVAEGLPNDSVAMRRKYFVCARNSACETSAAVDLAVGIHAMSAEDAAEIARLAVSVSMMLRALMR
jgi:four helix bundle protein